MAKASQRLTQRERQCRQVARDKAKRKRMGALMLRVRIAGAVVLAACLVTAGAWEYFGHGVSRTTQAALDRVYQATGRLGYTVQALYLDGRGRTPLAEVEQAIAVNTGDPIFGVSLSDIRGRLEALPTVKRAEVARALPNTISVRLIERQPVAVWQHGGKLSLIDDEGVTMNDLALADYPDLPLVLGEGAPKRVTEALNLWDAQPALKPLVMAMTRVGDRRWNVRMKNGTEVKLPEENASAAWAKLAQLQHEQKLLERAVRSVDMREQGRMFLKLVPVQPPALDKATARET